MKGADRVVMINNAQQKSETTITENMINRLSNDIEEKNNYFETVHLNVPEYSDSKDDNIDSLFGDKDFNQINQIIYEDDLTSNSKITKIFKFLPKINTKKIAVASILTVLLSGASFVGFSVMNLENNNFVADASPITEIESQNSQAKKEKIKSQIASGDLYNENYTFRYRLKEGDTIENLSRESGISVEAIKVMNGIKDNSLFNQETILIPTTKNIVHRISSGDTLEGVAKKYNVKIKDITELNKSNIKNPNYLRIDQTLFIPWKDAVKKAKTEKVSSRTKDIEKNLASSKSTKINNSRENSPIYKTNSSDTFASIAKKYKISLKKITEANSNITNLKNNQLVVIPTNKIDRNGSRSRGIRIASRSLSVSNTDKGKFSGRLFWPASGEFSSGFGPRGFGFHKGIDIAAAVGTPIMSAMNGKVIYTGWESGYGMTIEIRHSNNLVTRYAHCSAVYVSKGQNIEGGQKIAAMGMTGRVTGPHVHFEVLINGVQVNPRNYF